MAPLCTLNVTVWAAGSRCRPRIRQPSPTRAAWSVTAEAGYSRVDWQTTIPDAVRPFLCKIGRRGGHERSRNHARRTVRGWIRFNRRYQCDPSEVSATPVSASPGVWHYLRDFASRGGRSRAQKYPREQLRAWAAKGGPREGSQIETGVPPSTGCNRQAGVARDWLKAREVTKNADIAR